MPGSVVENEESSKLSGRHDSKAPEDSKSQLYDPSAAAAETSNEETLAFATNTTSEELSVSTPHASSDVSSASVVNPFSDDPTTPQASSDDPSSGFEISPSSHSSAGPRYKIPDRRTNEHLTPPERHQRNMQFYPELYSAAVQAFQDKHKDTKTKLTARQYIRMRRRNRTPIKHSVPDTINEDESDAETSWHRKKMGIHKKRKTRPALVKPVAALAQQPTPSSFTSSELSSPLSETTLAEMGVDTELLIQAPAPAPVRKPKGLRWTVEERQLILDIFKGTPGITIAAMAREWNLRMKDARTVDAVNLEYQKYRVYYQARTLPPPARLQQGK